MSSPTMLWLLLGFVVAVLVLMFACGLFLALRHTRPASPLPLPPPVTPALSMRHRHHLLHSDSYRYSADEDGGDGKRPRFSFDTVRPPRYVALFDGHTPPTPPMRAAHSLSDLPRPDQNAVVTFTVSHSHPATINSPPVNCARYPLGAMPVALAQHLKSSSTFIRYAPTQQQQQYERDQQRDRDGDSPDSARLGIQSMHHQPSIVTIATEGEEGGASSGHSQLESGSTEEITSTISSEASQPRAESSLYMDVVARNGALNNEFALKRVRNLITMRQSTHGQGHDESEGYDMSSGRRALFGGGHSAVATADPDSSFDVNTNIGGSSRTSPSRIVNIGAASTSSSTEDVKIGAVGAASQKSDENLFSPQTLVAIVGSIATSVAIVMVNKLVLNNGFPFASTLTALHQLTGYLFSTFLIYFKFIPQLPEPLPEYALARYYIAGLYSSGLVLMNQSLAMNPVAFYQLLKMSCIPAIALLQYILFKKVLPRPTVIALAVILLGVAISTMSPSAPKHAAPTHTANQSTAGKGATRRIALEEPPSSGGGIVALFMGLLTLLVSVGAVVTTALSQIELNQSPDLKRLSSFQSMNAMSLISFGVCMAAAAVVDMHIGFEDLLGFTVGTKIATFWRVLVAEAPVGWIFLSCALAILVNLFGFMLIKGTSPMTYQVVGHLKTVLTLAMGALLFGSAGLDGLKGLGVIVALVGMVIYSREKMNKRPASANTVTSSDPVPKKAKAAAIESGESNPKIKSTELETIKGKLKKVTPPRPSALNRVPHPKKLEEKKSKLKVATTVFKTDVVVQAASPEKGVSSRTSPLNKKALSSPARSSARPLSPEKVNRPASGDNAEKK
ncbi:triose-phosphate transporter family-domain-containing protein [Chytriomyces sp. MP71]|nr:triose-phosphate transporter family-domain-containing protein [Chytriomyces sp. MP71]